MTHTVEILLNGETPKTNIQMQIDMNTDAVTFTTLPTIKDTNCIKILNDLGTAIRNVHKLVGHIESLEMNSML